MLRSLKFFLLTVAVASAYGTRIEMTDPPTVSRDALPAGQYYLIQSTDMEDWTIAAPPVDVDEGVSADIAPEKPAGSDRAFFRIIEREQLVELGITVDYFPEDGALLIGDGNGNFLYPEIEQDEDTNKYRIRRIGFRNSSGSYGYLLPDSSGKPTHLIVNNEILTMDVWHGHAEGIIADSEGTSERLKPITLDSRVTNYMNQFILWLEFPDINVEVHRWGTFIDAVGNGLVAAWDESISWIGGVLHFIDGSAASTMDELDHEFQGLLPNQAEVQKLYFENVLSQIAHLFQIGETSAASLKKWPGYFVGRWERFGRDLSGELVSSGSVYELRADGSAVLTHQGPTYEGQWIVGRNGRYVSLNIGGICCGEGLRLEVWSDCPSHGRVRTTTDPVWQSCISHLLDFRWISVYYFPID